MEAAPPSVQMVQMLAGFQVSQALYAAAKLGIPDAVASGPRLVEDVASAVGAQPDPLRRLVRTLASMGVFSLEADDSLSLTPLGETLVDGSPGSMRDLALMWMETHYDPFGRLVDTLRTGEPAATSYYGAPFFSWLARDVDQVDRFSRAMANLTNGIKAGAVATYDFSDARSIVDVGAADGALLAKVLAVAGSAHGIAFDLPHVVAASEAGAKAFELGDRLRFVAGDFFESVPSGGDHYILSLILHDWTDEEAARILRNVHDAASPGARVLSFELILPPGDAPHMAKMIDLTMLAMLTGHERTEPELRALVEGAGFRSVRVLPTPTPISIVEATV